MVVADARVAAATTTIHAEGLCSVTLWLVAQWVSGEPTLVEPDKFVEQRWCTFADGLPAPLFDVWADLAHSRGYQELVELVAGDRAAVVDELTAEHRPRLSPIITVKPPTRG